MSAPRLTRRMVLEAPERQPDGAGGFTTVWVAKGTLWAACEARTGRDGRAGAAPVARVPWRITMRAAPVGAEARPVAGQRLREGARIFAIRAVAEADDAGRYLRCEAEEERAV